MTLSNCRHQDIKSGIFYSIKDNSNTTDLDLKIKIFFLFFDVCTFCAMFDRVISLRLLFCQLKSLITIFFLSLIFKTPSGQKKKIWPTKIKLIKVSQISNFFIGLISLSFTILISHTFYHNLLLTHFTSAYPTNL